MIDETPVVRVRDLTKRFGKTVALDNVSLDINPGRIVGLLGANAAGKSTLLRHITGLHLPNAGTCATLGCDAARLTPDHLARIGYVHQDGELLDWMTARQMIRYVSAYYTTWNRDLEQHFIDNFEIPVKKRVGTLSPGQRQRLAILIAVAFEPELLILDEPAAALDPIARVQFLDLLMEIIQDPRRTVIISSHILSDVEKIIDHVVIMDRGRILRDCAFDALQEAFCRLHVTAPDAGLPDDLPFTGVLDARRSDTEAVLLLPTPSPDDLTTAEDALRCRIHHEPLSLEDLYRIVVSHK